MKNSHQKIDISKYKFIPPSKLLKNKSTYADIIHSHSVTEPTHQASYDHAHVHHTVSPINNNYHHYSSISDSSPKNSPALQQGVGKDQNKQNIADQIIFKKGFKLFKTSSTANIARNSTLELKNPPTKNVATTSRDKLKNKSRAQVLENNENCNQNSSNFGVGDDFPQYQIKHLNRMTRYIEELQSQAQEQKLKNEEYQKQISKLKENNQQLTYAITCKNNKIQQLTLKNKQYEQRVKQKCFQHGLIIDSLKKVIESQVIKIADLEKDQQKNEESILSQITVHDEINQKFQRDPTDERNERSPTFMQKFKNMSSRFGDDHHNIESDTDELNTDNDLSLLDHPCFENEESGENEYGAEQQSESVSESGLELECKIVDFAKNHHPLQLSRISESLEESELTEEEKKGIKTKEDTTHQELLEQIDRYLSKCKNKQPSNNCNNREEEKRRNFKKKVFESY